MKNNTFKCFGLLISFLSLLLIQSFGQNTESLSLKLGGYLQIEQATGVIPSQMWNTVIKGNSTGLLNNTGEVTACFMRSNATEVINNSVDEILLKNSLQINAQEFVSILNIPYEVYDVYIYVCPESEVESTAKITINNQSKIIKLTKNAWDGQLDESLASSENEAQSGKDYVVFKGLKGNEFTIWTESKEKIGLSAIQITKSSSSEEVATSAKGIEKSINAFAYPNPVKDGLYLEIANEYTGNLVCKVIDMQGKEVASFTKVKPNKTFLEKINVEQWKAGSYYIIVNFGKEKVTLPIVKH